MPNNIKRFEEFIDESLLGSIQKKVMNGEVRKEDEYHHELNIKDLKPAIHKGGVYWADDLLEIDGLPFISSDDFHAIPPRCLKGWRLPTADEFKKMVEETTMKSHGMGVYHLYENPDMGGRFISVDTDETIMIQEVEPDTQTAKLNSYQGIRGKTNAVYPSGLKSFQFVISPNDKSECYIDHERRYNTVRLVRDEKINESLLGGIQKKVMADEVRLEDMVETNIDKLKAGPCIEGLYWSSDIMEINGDWGISISLFKKITKKQLNGWRLPTRKEFDSLIYKGYRNSTSHHCTYVSDVPDIDQNNSIMISSNECYIVQEDDGSIKNAVTFDDNGEIINVNVGENTKATSNYIVAGLLVRNNKI